MPIEMKLWQKEGKELISFNSEKFKS